MTRIFLDELSKELIDRFKTKKITVEYIDAGKNLKDFDKKYLDVMHDSTNAVLLFLPSEEADFATYYKHLYFSMPDNLGRVGINASKQKMAYHQSFYINLYVHPKTQSPSWQVFLAVMSEISKDKMYSSLAKKIVSLLQEKGYFL